VRRRSKEINIFSMSALDLFASALGAFMLLAVIFFPFFPNVGNSEERLEDIKKQLEAALEKKEQADAEKATADKARADADKKSKDIEAEITALDKQPINFPDMDIVFALDTTGSMRATISSLKSEIADFGKLLSEWAPSVGIGMIDYKDICEGPGNEFRPFPLVEITTATLADLQGFANLAAAGGSGCNGPAPESLGGALDQSISMPWRSVSKIRMIVVITDAPPYDHERASTLTAAQTFNARGSAESVSVVLVGGTVDTETYLGQLASSGGGHLVKGRTFTASIMKILGKL